MTLTYYDSQRRGASFSLPSHQDQCDGWVRLDLTSFKRSKQVVGSGPPLIQLPPETRDATCPTQTHESDPIDPTQTHLCL